MEKEIMNLIWTVLGGLSFVFFATSILYFYGIAVEKSKGDSNADLDELKW